MEAIQLHIGGVPEHFNLPWRMAIEQGVFAQKNINLTWTDFPGGTGAMTQALRNKELDLAIVLTEGIVSDILNGNQAKILKVYVKSPLTWGIYVSKDSPIQHISETAKLRYAISRLGSGSHLMAYVNALQQGWNPKEMQFVPLKNLTGIRKGLQEDIADVFMWEKVMTQPYVASGELKLIDECITPWSCFLLVVRNEIWEKYPAVIQEITQVINSYCQDFKHQPQISDIIAKRYQLDVQEVENWLTETEWATDNSISEEMIDQVIKTLLDLHIVKQKAKYEDLVVVG